MREKRASREREREERERKRGRGGKGVKERGKEGERGGGREGERQRDRGKTPLSHVTSLLSARCKVHHVSDSTEIQRHTQPL